ncbi:hypothetical protein Tco_0839929 [Tanacetum coccineum]|uniref:Uncharacterized protein n=1 Tax=Tanacetum coccineum TaxID=301880 RepID=A0ABQ5AUR4_9ASTR
MSEIRPKQCRYTVKTGLEWKVFNKLLKVREARHTFDDIAEYDQRFVLWNMMLRSYGRMQQQGFKRKEFCLLSGFRRIEVVHLYIDNLQQCVLSEYAKGLYTNIKHKEQVQA